MRLDSHLMPVSSIGAEGGGGHVSLVGPISLAIWDLVRGHISLAIQVLGGRVSLEIWGRGGPKKVGA